MDKELAKKIEEFDGYIVKMIPTSSLEFIYCILLGERQHSVEGEFDDLYEPGEDFLSTSAMNFLLYHNDEPVGYIRLLASEKFFLLTHYYVEPKSRGRISLIFLRIVLSEFFKNDDVIRMTYHVKNKATTKFVDRYKIDTIYKVGEFKVGEILKR